MKKTKKTTKTVKNPLTGKTYKIHSRTEINPEAGSIRGLWERGKSH
jgi:hypothetical protein